MFKAKVGGIIKGEAFIKNKVRCFKLTNRIEKSFTDLIYCDGKNTDINLLESENTYGKGIHFSDGEHILSYCGELDEPFFIREVTLPENEDVYVINTGDFRSRSLILDLRKELFNIDTIKWMKENQINIHTKNDYFLLSAVIHSDLEVIKYLVEEEDFDVHTYDDRALELANIYNKRDIAMYLAELV